MALERDDHYVFVDSLARGNVGGDNAASHFSNILARPLMLDGAYEVGLKDFFIPSEIYSVPKENEEFAVEIGYRCTPSSGYNYELKPCQFKPSKGIKSEHVHNIINSIDEQLVAFLVSKRLLKAPAIPEDVDTIFHFSPMSKKVSLNNFIPLGLSSSEDCTILFTFKSKIARLLGFPANTPIPAGQVGDFYPEYIPSVQSLAVHCDIVAEAFDGSREARVLAILPFGKTFSRSAPSVIYRPVDFNTITRIGISIRDQKGDPVPFVDEGSARVILHFRRNSV